MYYRNLQLDKSLWFLLCMMIVVSWGSTVAAADRDAVMAATKEFISQQQAAADSHNRWDSLIPPNTEVVDVSVSGNNVTITFNRYLGYRSWHPDSADDLLAALRDGLGATVAPADRLAIMVRYGDRGDSPALSLEEHITTSDAMAARQSAISIPPPILEAPSVERVDYPGPPRDAGLSGRNIVVGPSHGFTWHTENRWQYQRARVYTMIEDLFPLQYINQYLAPMLENAGATVWSVRERDYQTGEIIVDNDETTRYSEFTMVGDWTPADGSGWSGGRPAYLDQLTEPFSLGSAITAVVPESGSMDQARAVYTPYIPHQGRYAVYASWTHAPGNSPSVPVQIRHLGGMTTVRVNQQIAGNTWVFLGFFEFDMGANFEKGSVTITTEGAAPSSNADASGEATMISADAVRFGGGMGNIAPMDTISGKPRYTEGSMYWLQYAGAPMESVYLRRFNAPHFGLDYWSDIAARAEWPNHLYGAPNGPNPVDGRDYRSEPGLGVPVDMYLSWHTDAGFDEEGLIGTLSIYRVWDDTDSDTFPDGRSRWLNRDLTVLMNEEVVRSARELYTSSWARRFVWERDLGEVRRPNVPSTLIELLSHHNFNDMKYGLDPRFQFDMSRAIYKSIARFLAYSHGYDPVIQPLPPLAPAARHLGDGNVLVQWKPQSDPLEPTAEPTGYIVYTSKDGRSFDNGRCVDTDSITLEGLDQNVSWYFKVTAVNAGGESFPSSVVGVRWAEGVAPVLIVDGFDRICAPAIVHQNRTHGFDRDRDAGVPFHYNYALIGDQYDFDPAHKWENDLESPGMGGSSNNLEDEPEKGNTFDHIVAHGEAFAANDIAFDSVSAGAFVDGAFPVQYGLIDWIAGEQKATPPPAGMPGNGNPDRMTTEFPVMTREAMQRLGAHLANGGRLLISGAYVIEDLTLGPMSSLDGVKLAEDGLGIRTAVSRSTRTNNVVPIKEAYVYAEMEPFWFGRDLEPPINILPTVYKVESAESFIAVDSGTRALMIYGDTELPAVVTNGATIVMGFPIETVMPPVRRAELLKASYDHLMNQP